MSNLNSATTTKRSTLKKWPTPAQINATMFGLADIWLRNKIVRYNTATIICSYQVPSSVLGDWLHIVTLPCNNGSRG